MSLSLIGCAATAPYTGRGPHPQIERGAPFAPVDFLGNVLALPAKLILWDWNFAKHSISEETENYLVLYLDDRDIALINEAHFRLNQYRPFNDFSRLVKNKNVAWPYRVLLGFPTWIVEAVLPGRLFPWGDYYNPFSNTVHIYSDHPAVVLHEAGHVYDFSGRRFKGTYAFVRSIPYSPVSLYQEFKASQEAIRYLQEIEDREAQINAHKILHPAYGTYVGAYIFPVIGSIVGAIVGHATGRTKASNQQRQYEEEKALLESSEAPSPKEPEPALD